MIVPSILKLFEGLYCSKFYNSYVSPVSQLPQKWEKSVLKKNKKHSPEDKNSPLWCHILTGPSLRCFFYEGLRRKRPLRHARGAALWGDRGAVHPSLPREVVAGRHRHEDGGPGLRPARWERRCRLPNSLFCCFSRPSCVHFQRF